MFNISTATKDEKFQEIYKQLGHLTNMELRSMSVGAKKAKIIKEILDSIVYVKDSEVLGGIDDCKAIGTNYDESFFAAACECNNGLIRE